MKKIDIPVGTSSFAEIRRENYYYVDKSGLIKELLRTRSTKVTLITRPRRFGKTLSMSMLSEFFDISKDSRKLFEGLIVAENEALCAEWMNQYPTLFLSLKKVDGLDYNGAAEQFKIIVSDMCIAHDYLLQSDRVSELKKERFLRLAKKEAVMDEVKDSLSLVLSMLASHYGKPVILLIDEYDVPLAKASEKGYYTEMLDVVKGLMQAVKDNDNLKMAVITGCLRIAKESIFTGTNNFVSDTISDTRLNEYFGFTQSEVDKLLRNVELTDHADELRKWYDGYHFGDFDVYCPWDVMNHVNNLLLNPKIKPASYWKNSSDNAIIRSFIDFAGASITEKLEKLMSGEYIIQKIKEDLTYDYVNSSEENLWSILYLTGYLTRVRETELKRTLEKDNLALKIPNAEVMEIYESTIKNWFIESTRQTDRKTLFMAIWSGECEKATREMTKLLRKTISYHDYREDFYHAFFAGIFAGAGYVVESNKEHGEGRSDVIVKDYTGDRVAVFEIKYSKSQNGLDQACDEALVQIDDRMYAAELGDDYSKVICYGISFYKKRCLVKKK